MKLYKLTDAEGQTYNQTQWGPDVTHTTSGEGPLCSPGWIHAYTDPLLAVLLNPLHANFQHPQLWEAEGEVGIDDSGLKVGCKTLTTIRQLSMPEVSTIQKVAFGILCMLERRSASPKFVAWAEDWLSGKDRSRAAAHAAYADYAAADYAAYAAADYAAYYAAYAADYAAAYAAAHAAAYAADYAADYTASYAADYAAYYAAYAASYAAHMGKIDLIALAHRSI